MKSNFNYYSLLAFFLVSTLSFSQQEASKWKALFAVGLNSPSQTGFVKPFQAKATNFPTINLGIQHMFKPLLGVKLDFGYNRLSNAKTAPDFKLNFTRINVQIVYDTKNYISFLPENMGIVVHAGPGYTMIKPLGFYSENKNSYLNAMAGIELHYGVSRTLSLFIDTSYIVGFAKDFDPIADGTGSFNGNMLTLTVGASVSLSGCRTCN
ncbi:outer membrane beta-barrel protein [Lacinutrix jangbogonensis]|uniref:outer membrane beta-barrel protein n=1 Tax=Lacinutrix jangbogonensis TaxID=1469557 RepID=UPI00053E04CC|nr:outer membrane beta-barrel protein [Lacinutrix jangbogonensis]